MRRIAFPLVVAVAFLAACASKEPAERQRRHSRARSRPRRSPGSTRKAQEATPKQRAVIKTELAAGYYERGQFDVAIDVLKEAEQLDAANPQIYDIYGLVYTMLGEPQKAEASFRRALSIAPNNPDFACQLGRVPLRHGRESESIPEFERRCVIRCTRPPKSRSSTPASARSRSATARRPTNTSGAR
jgi:Tfp pilus assembly protein PilF